MRWALPLLALGGCAGLPEPSPGSCRSEAAAALSGRLADAALGAEVLRLTGARSLRWVQPDSVMTMDFRADRANIELDAANRVRAIRCG